ncbi:MAG: 3-deoxy-D-manno-octulosonic acid transferase [Candidatus Accumulibacter sp.]|nr:3-deoxy-D-manno-octulosonic acid transferase [Accumulibacter sp.]
MIPFVARFLYSLVFYLATPLVWLRLLWRARKQPEYLRHVGERYGFYAPPPLRPLIWLHAVSVGETRAAAPLLEALLLEYPQHTVLLTHMTPTGRTTGGEFVRQHAGRVVQAYLPYDLPDACARFLAHFQPQLGLLMETELWPNLIAAAHARGVPLALINARLSVRSARGYARFGALAHPAFKALAAVAAQTSADAERLRALGASAVTVCGNLKFDVTPASEKLQLGTTWRQALGARPAWLAASTREGEEAAVLDAFDALRAKRPDALLILVPRHPQRFDEVAALLDARGLRYCRRSRDELPDDATQVWLGDSMGEMAAWYAAADLALIGGSLLPFGGQNLIEAAACGCPVLVGPHTFNFAQAAEDAVACGAARRVADAGDAARTAAELLRDREQLKAMREAALAFSRAHRGATARTVALIREISGLRTGS